MKERQDKSGNGGLLNRITLSQFRNRPIDESELP
jgi:hypothetical protein